MEYSKIPPEVIADDFPTYKKLIMERLKHKEMANTFNMMLEDDYDGKNVEVDTKVVDIPVPHLTWERRPYKAEVISSSLIAPTSQKPSIYIGGFVY